MTWGSWGSALIERKNQGSILQPSVGNACIGKIGCVLDNANAKAVCGFRTVFLGEMRLTIFRLISLRASFQPRGFFPLGLVVLFRVLSQKVGNHLFLMWLIILAHI